ncbi:MAG: sensor domain-containing protein, partial [Gammaproteobacteria bacterium]|nr:sensor domain-containing protein [Gammaproteobacteria bacterium]
FFGVYADPRAYSSLFYMLIALATGVFYFVWAVAGLSLSVGFMILIIGVPFFLLFLSSVRLFSLLEGRIVETFLGVRMPRRPVYEKKDKPILTRIGEMLSDARTWSTLVYLLLMLPLGVAYFVIAVTTVVTSVAFILSPLAEIVTVTLDMDFTPFYWHGPVYLDWWESILLSASGVILLTAALHLFKGIGYMQGRIARGLLVKYAE